MTETKECTKAGSTDPERLERLAREAEAVRRGKPILFSAPMVRALIEGRKTQTRRVLKPQPDMAKISQPCHPEPRGAGRWVWMARDDSPGYSFATADFVVRFAVGDRLWVRERTWMPDGNDPHGHITYHADHGDDRVLKWRPGIQMPRWASRLTLTVTDVRVQRLRRISNDDALAEGITRIGNRFVVPGVPHPNPDFPELSRPSAREMFAALWDVIHGSGAWLSDPWIVALTFTVEQRNIGAEQ